MRALRPLLLGALTALGLAALVASPGGGAHADPAATRPWPQWLGADGQGIADGSVGASPAVAGGTLYIRGQKHLLAIGDAPAS